MKFGIRTPNLKSRIKAKTTGKITRSIKKSVNPMYGKSGLGYINDPKKALYNKIYNRTTVSINLNLKTKSGKLIHDFETISDFLSDVDLETISYDDIDEMTIEALEILYSSNLNKKLSKECKRKMDRIESKIILSEIIPANLSIPETVKTKSGKTRHEFVSDFRYLADLDLSTFTDDIINSLDSDTVKAIYEAKNTSFKRTNEKSNYKKIKQKYFNSL